MEVKLLNQNMQLKNPLIKSRDVHVDFDYEQESEEMYIFSLTAYVGCSDESLTEYRFMLSMDFECYPDSAERQLDEEQLVHCIIEEIMEPFTNIMIGIEGILMNDEEIELHEEYELA